MSPAVEVRGRAGRYVIFDELASGGMASVHLGRLLGSAGFVRTVAIKRLHPHFARDPDFVAMFTDEARLAARFRHPNVAVTLDVVTADRELFLVMEYIHGESLSKLLRTTSKREEQVPLDVAVGIAVGILHGLHAAHEATSETGAPLGVVHRDVSPQNVMVGADGIPRLVDFGVAKAVGRLQTTRDGEVKGKTGYIAPEQLRGSPIDRRADVYAAAVVLWETLTGHRLFAADSSAEVMMQVLTAPVDPPSHYRREVPPTLDALVLRGLARDPTERFATALEFALALERSIAQPSARSIASWLESAAGEVLEERAARVLAVERHDLSGLKLDTLPTSFVPQSVPDLAAVAQPVTVRMMPPAARSRRSATTLLAVGGVLAVVLSLVAFTRRPKPATAPAATSAPMAEPSAPPVLPVVTSAVVVPQVSAAPAPPATASHPPARVAPPRPAKPTPRKATRQCDPPYTVDADGIHIPKPECE